MSMDKSKIIDKVRKLLALSDSSNENEAFLAAKRARALMDKHELSKNEISNAESSEFLEEKAKHEYKQRNAWVITLQAAVALLNDCEAVIIYDDGIVTHKFRGFTADVIVSTMTLDYLIDACDRHCNESGVKGRSNKNQFRLAFATSISIKANDIYHERKEQFEKSNTGTSLITLKSQQIADHFGTLKDYTPKEARKPTLSELEAYRKGALAGERTGLDKQINE